MFPPVVLACALAIDDPLNTFPNKFSLQNLTFDYTEPWLATITNQRPVFRWVVVDEGSFSNGAVQETYRVQVSKIAHSGLQSILSWDSGVVDSNASSVPYNGKALEQDTDYRVTVTVTIVTPIAFSSSHTTTTASTTEILTTGIMSGPTTLANRLPSTIMDWDGAECQDPTPSPPSYTYTTMNRETTFKYIS